MNKKIPDANTHIIRNHLRDNSGDGYVWFLFMTIVLLLLFGALFAIMSTAANTRDIRTGVDEAAADVFAEMRESAYDRLTDGATDFSEQLFAPSNYEVMQMFASHLSADFHGEGLTPYIQKTSVRGRLAYRIDNMEFYYIDEINNNRPGKAFLGDITGDKIVDDNDMILAREYYEEYKSDPASFPIEKLEIVDLDDDGIFDESDLALLQGLIQYFATHPQSSLESETEKSSALLMITFRLTIPKEFGSVSFGNSIDTYAYTSIFSVKAA